MSGFFGGGPCLCLGFGSPGEASLPPELVPAALLRGCLCCQMEGASGTLLCQHLVLPWPKKSVGLEVLVYVAVLGLNV